MNPPDAPSTPLTHGDMLTAISDGLAALLREFYGRGPTRAQSLALDCGIGASAFKNRGGTMTAEGIDRDVGRQRGGGTI